MEKVNTSPVARTAECSSIEEKLSSDFSSETNISGSVHFLFPLMCSVFPAAAYPLTLDHYRTQ